jgi:ketosteroid isomerase-like protein
MPSGRAVASNIRETSVALVMEFYAAFNRGNIDAAVDFLHLQFEWRPAFGRALLGHNVYFGRDGFRSYYRDVGDTFVEYRVELRDVEPIEDELLLLHVSASGTGRRSGAKIASRYVILYELRDGLIVRGQTFSDRDQAVASCDR